MPPAILALTRTYQKDPVLVQIQMRQETVENIEQVYIDVPMGRKMDALNLILRYENPQLAMIFCNTKRMVDEIAAYLDRHGFMAEGLHGDMKQSQRTKVMEGFKHGRTGILAVSYTHLDVYKRQLLFFHQPPQDGRLRGQGFRTVVRHEFQQTAPIPAPLPENRQVLPPSCV